jgi:transcriptional regulatory protein RtcR
MDKPRKTVVIGLLGVTLDAVKRGDRWQQWRPSVDICRHDDLVVDRFELLFQPHFGTLAAEITSDIAAVSPETQVRAQHIDFNDPWDFQEVYGALHDFASRYDFKPGAEQYLVHITTGTHVAQICQFLLTESRHIPARLLQSGPPKERGKPGSYSIIDLDLSKYDRIASRFRLEQSESREFLKSGIATRNKAFNKLIERIEQVAIASKAPLLLMGPTGAGKSQLARRVYELKKLRKQIAGRFVEVNCATIRGDGAMSALFGHTKGAFTGAAAAREGLLREANSGILFLDEIGELGLEEQAMLLRAIEEGRFLPVGSDREVESAFQLISGTNRDLHRAVAQQTFRDDLLARINLWTFQLPALRERSEDIEPNLDYELARWTETHGNRVAFSQEARKLFLDFASSPGATWAGNFRDFSAAVERMATLSDGGRITVPAVREELDRLRASWQRPGASGGDDVLARFMDEATRSALDLFDRVQLAEVLRVCSSSKSLSDAGRTLFSESRKRRSSTNDADRVRKYLARFGISWADIAG